MQIVIIIPHSDNLFRLIKIERKLTVLFTFYREKNQHQQGSLKINRIYLIFSTESILRKEYSYFRRSVAFNTTI